MKKSKLNFEGFKEIKEQLEKAYRQEIDDLKEENSALKAELAHIYGGVK